MRQKPSGLLAAENHLFIPYFLSQIASSVPAQANSSKTQPTDIAKPVQRPTIVDAAKALQATPTKRRESANKNFKNLACTIHFLKRRQLSQFSFVGAIPVAEYLKGMYQILHSAWHCLAILEAEILLVSGFQIFDSR